MKTILLPREWNDPNVPPDELIDVIVKCSNQCGEFIIVGHIYNGVWMLSYGTDTDLEEANILGWAAIVQS